MSLVTFYVGTVIAAGIFFAIAGINNRSVKAHQIVEDDF